MVPEPSVLVRQQDQTSVGHPGVAPEVLQDHQGQQGVQLATSLEVGWQQLADDPDQPDRLGREVGAQHLRAGAGCIARREAEVGHGGDQADPLDQDGAGGQHVRLGRQPLPGPGQPSGHRGRADQEQPGDVLGGQPEHHPQGECGGALPRQHRRAAEQHQPQPLVDHVLTHRRHRPLGLLLEAGLHLQRRTVPHGHRLGPQMVEDPAPRSGQQPGGRVGRCPGRSPRPGGTLEGVGERVLSEVEAPVLGHQQGQQPSPLRPPDLGQPRWWWSRPRPHPSSTAGRISIV